MDPADDTLDADTERSINDDDSNDDSEAFAAVTAARCNSSGVGNLEGTLEKPLVLLAKLAMRTRIFSAAVKRWILNPLWMRNRLIILSCEIQIEALRGKIPTSMPPSARPVSPSAPRSMAFSNTHTGPPPAYKSLSTSRKTNN